QLILAILSHGPQQHAASDAEKLPPELTGFLEAVGTKWFHFEFFIAKCLHGDLYGFARFSSYGRSSIIFEICDARSAGGPSEHVRGYTSVAELRPAHRNRRRAGIS